MMLKAATLLAASLALLAPPSGRPPVGPLQREKPRVYDIRFDVTINTMIPFRQDDPRLPRSRRRISDPRDLEWGGTLHLRDTPIVMPLVYRGTYHTIDPDSVRARLWFGTHEDRSLPQRFRVDPGLPHHGHLAVLPIVQFDGKLVRWDIAYRVQTFSSRIDEGAAAAIPWPRDWPKEVADGLAPQMFIESDDPIFAEAVKRITKGQSRLVAPYLVAKELVGHCLRTTQVNGDGVERGRMGILHGMQMTGALSTIKSGRGSGHDLVCLCVAMLRAAGIPARPVIGITKRERGRQRFVTWAEFFLPDAGWIPFDPVEMHGSASHRDVHRRWREFGTMDHLNRRIPMAYHFMPPRAVEAPQAPALWGWDPRPAGAPPAEQRISFTITSRGTGATDPQ